MGYGDAARVMNAEFLAVLEYWEKEKGISREILISAVNEALITAAKKAVGAARELRCEINPKTGEIKAFAKLIVVEVVQSKHDEISRFDARRIKEDASIGDEVEIEVTPMGFGRVAAQFAKQALMQQVRRAEKNLIYTEFKDRTGDIVSGIVRRFERSDVIIDLGRYEAIMPNRERVPIEEYQLGERIRCFVKAVEETVRGPEIILSRSDPQFVIRLFQLEVSEIGDGTVEIKGIAREPGFRTKLAVHSRDPRVDPVGACVGLRGQRVKNIVRELNNEKVDIIRWDADIRILVTNALAPARIKSISVDESKKQARVLVNEDQLSLTIGRRGQNARLTSRITGWQIDIDAEAAPVINFDQKVTQVVDGFAQIPGISREHATLLVNTGFHSFEDLKQVELSDIAEIPGLTESAAGLIDAVRAEALRRDKETQEAATS